MKKWLKVCVLVCFVSTGGFADEEQTINYEEAKKIIKEREKENAQRSMLEKSGLLLGMSIGGGLPYSESASNSSDSVKSQVLAVGVMGGYQKFFSSYSGIRAYGSLDVAKGFGSLKSGGNPTGDSASAMAVKQDLIMFSANLDAIVGVSFGEDKSKSIGLIGGLGYGALLYDDNFSGGDGMQTGIILNAGVFFSIGKHRFELLSKVLPLKYIDIQVGGSQAFFANVLGMLGYSYVF